MSKLRFVFSACCILVVSLLAVSPAYAVTDQQDICEDNGGTWTGATAFTGNCGYGDGNPVAIRECGEHKIYSENFTNGSFDGAHCTNRPFSYGGAGSETQNSTQSVTLSLGQNKNGSVTFSPGACPKKCTISSNIARMAKNGLPADTLATLSVRIVGGAGGSYLVCFKTIGISQPTIYKFVGGSWVRIATISSGNRLCAASTGTASYYLGSG
ncbi:MAG TPA: hypothetical protein VLK33_20675 [Terriglobales bacterium]|nr:hypothetical protein [Terriglobales bacterium]